MGSTIMRRWLGATEWEPGRAIDSLLVRSPCPIAPPAALAHCTSPRQDVDGDGLVTAADAAELPPALRAALDTDSDGVVSLEEA